MAAELHGADLLALSLESIQQRDEHWVIADPVCKAGHVRTVPIPVWVKIAVDAWTSAAAITHGPVFRAINKAGRVWGDGMSPKVLWDVARAAALAPASTGWHHTIFGAPVPDCATWLAENWTRFSFFSTMSPFRRRSAISDASRSSVPP